MAKRKRIGINFSYNEGWIAGSYYTLNLVSALNFLPDYQKPKLIVVSSKSSFSILQDETNYKYLKKFKVSFLKRIINKIGSILFKVQLVSDSISKRDVDFIYPCHMSELSSKSKVKKLFWVPDYQEKYYPHFFSKEDIDTRDQQNKNLLYSKNDVVFSSNNSQNDAEKFYPDSSATTHVLQFAVSLPQIENITFDYLKTKYNLPDLFFFCPNQFWQHKNHIIILKAISILKLRGVEINVVFSGKQEDNRVKDHFESLIKYIEDNNISDNVTFLGFLDRSEQLAILNFSTLVIQPSLFEGWSTVVEDCKSLNKFILISDLEVHTEQIQENCDFFDKNDEIQLANMLHKYVGLSPVINPKNYIRNIEKFALDFIEISNKI
ncbi:MAG: glycosyltransferase involved in cell wall biosynthesis [Psychroserpens sp.]|jgi:glycosyltransferase involved in cell wall biosynthesis